MSDFPWMTAAPPVSADPTAGLSDADLGMYQGKQGEEMPPDVWAALSGLPAGPGGLPPPTGRAPRQAPPELMMAAPTGPMQPADIGLVPLSQAESDRVMLTGGPQAEFMAQPPRDTRGPIPYGMPGSRTQPDNLTGETLPVGVSRPGLSGAALYEQLMRGLPRTQGGGGSSVSTTNAVIDPGTATAMAWRMGEATSRQQDAVQEKSKIAEAMQRDLGAQAREQAAGTAATFKAYEAQRAAVDARIEAQMADNARAIEDMKKAEIDPDKIYKGEGGSTKRLFHVIGMALGSFGATLGKTKNFAMEMVNGEINRSMAAQTAEMAKKKFVYEAGRNMVADLYRKSGDLEKSFLMGKMIYTDIAKAQAESISRDAQSEEAKYNGEVLSAQLEQQQLQNEMNLKRLEYRRETRTVTRSAGSPTAASQMAAQLTMAANAREEGLSLNSGAKDATPKATIQQTLGAVKALKGLDRLEKIYMSNAPGALPNALSKSSTLAYRDALGPWVDQYVYAVTGASATKDLVEKYESRVPSGLQTLGPVGWGGERDAAQGKRKFAAMRSSLMDVINTNTPGSSDIQARIKAEDPVLYRRIMGNR